MKTFNKNQIADIHRKALEKFMEDRGLNVFSWSKKAGLTESTLRNFLNGGGSITSKTLYALAAAENTTISEILGETDEGDNHYQMVPLLNSVPATNFQEVIDRPVEHHISYPSKKKTLIALHVVGESMNRYAPDGSIIIVDTSQITPSELIGKPVVAQIGNEGSFKIYKANPDRFEPYSTLPDYETIYPKEGEEWHIAGRVIGVINNLEDDETQADT